MRDYFTTYYHHDQHLYFTCTLTISICCSDKDSMVVRISSGRYNMRVTVNTVICYFITMRRVIIHGLCIISTE